MPEPEKSPTFKEFRAFVAAHGDDVKRFVYRRVARESVTDVVRETFLMAWQKWSRIPAAKARQRTRVLRFSHRIIAKTHRQQREHRIFTATEDSDEFTARAFQRLTYGEQDFLAFIAWDGFTPTDAARILNLSLGAFTLRLSKARTQLGRRYRREQRRSDARVSNKKLSDLWRRRAAAKRLNDIDQLRPLDPVGELENEPLPISLDQVARDITAR